MSKKRKAQVFSLEKLNSKGTRELMGYLKRLRKCEESFEQSDMEVNQDHSDPKIICFKDSDIWRLAYKHVKSILKNREHLEN